MSAAVPNTSVQDYLRLDAQHDGKLELLSGVVVAMAKASPRHNLIVSNLARLLGNALDGKCLVMTQHQRVRVESTESYVYPDVVVVCGEPSFDDARPPSLTNPTAVVEVLSPTTEEHDLVAKPRHYRRIPSIGDIAFVRIDERATTSVSRQNDGSWRLIDGDATDPFEVAGVRLEPQAVYAHAETLPL